jgi:hypothetical protein
MSSWGAGLYEDDEACDLRASVKAVCRLPLEGPALLKVLLENEGDASPAFWLVVADQFQKKGIDSEARERALHILDTGQDLERCARLGMAPPLLEKRRKALLALALELRQGKNGKRTTMRKPQPLLMQVGEVLTYPVAQGKPLNPYLGAREDNSRWEPDGWAALVIAEAAQLFGYLAWYRPAVAQQVWPAVPSLHQVLGVTDWRLSHAATCSSSHFKRLELRKIGQLSLSPDWGQHLNSRMMSGKSAALRDVSIANRMNVEPGDSFGRISRARLLQTGSGSGN